jgi:hypothetical protein
MEIWINLILQKKKKKKSVGKPRESVGNLGLLPLLYLKDERRNIYSLRKKGECGIDRVPLTGSVPFSTV